MLDDDQIILGYSSIHANDVSVGIGAPRGKLTKFQYSTTDSERGTYDTCCSCTYIAVGRHVIEGDSQVRDQRG